MNENYSPLGSGIYISEVRRSNVKLRNSLLDGRQSAPDCYGRLSQNTGNFIADGTCSPKLSGDPMLEAPDDSSTYYAPQAGSPVIRAADPRFCLETDQFGNPRAIVGACDIGAIESFPVRREVSDCQVTPINVLNFREIPNGKKIGQVPRNQTLRTDSADAGLVSGRA